MQRKERNKGIIISQISDVSRKLYVKIPKSFIGNLFSKEHKRYNGLFSYLSDLIKFKKRISTPIKRYMAKAFDNSLILNKAKLILSAAPSLQMKVIGLFLFAFGLVCSVSALLEQGLIVSLSDIGLVLPSLLIFCSGGILTLSQKNCYNAVSESKILSALIFGLLGIKKRDKYTEENAITKAYLGFAAGIIAGIIGAVTGPMTVLSFILSVLAVVIIMQSPESGVVMMFIALPFATAPWGAAITVTVATSYFIKLMRGKRTLNLSFFEFVILAFAVALSFGGSISLIPSQSTEYSALLLCSVLAYFVIANCIKTAEWISRCIKALLISFGIKLIFAVFGIASYFLRRTDYSYVSELVSDSSHKLLGYNFYLSVLCVALLPFIFIQIINSTKESRRSLYIILTGFSISCLIFGHSSGALVSVVLGFVLLLLLSTPNSLGIIVSALVGIPTTLMLLPRSATEYLSNLLGISHSSISSHLTVSASEDTLLSDVLFGGIGLGEHNAELIYPIYGFDPTASTYECTNTYSALMIGIGLTGLFIFTVLVFTFARRFFAYVRTAKNDDVALKNICVCSFTGAISVLLMGFTSNIFKDPSVFAVFFYLCAITICTANVAKNDRKEMIIDGPYLDISYTDNTVKATRKDV